MFIQLFSKTSAHLLHENAATVIICEAPEMLGGLQNLKPTFHQH